MFYSLTNIYILSNLLLSAYSICVRYGNIPFILRCTVWNAAKQCWVIICRFVVSCQVLLLWCLACSIHIYTQRAKRLIQKQSTLRAGICVALHCQSVHACATFLLNCDIDHKFNYLVKTLLLPLNFLHQLSPPLRPNS